MKLQRTIHRFALTAALVILGAGCGAPKEDSGESAETRVPVVTQRVTARDVDFTVTTLGTIKAWREVVVSARTSGRILELNFEKGDAVRPKPAGEAERSENGVRPLAVLEQQEYKLRWLEAEAVLTEAQRSFERSKRLFEQEGVAESEFDAVKAQYEVAQARRDLAKKAYNDTVIYSPIAGIVVARPVEAGEFVAPGTPLATVADVSKVKVATSVSELDSPYVRVGETYAVRVDAFPGRVFDGKVIYKSIKADVQTRSFPIELEVDNADGALGIGMVARVTFVLRTAPDAIAVPLDSLVYWENTLGVFVVEQDDTAAFRALTLGERSGDDVIVAKGLAAAEEVVVVGQERLRPGSKVTRPDEKRAAPADDESAGTSEVPESAP